MENGILVTRQKGYIYSISIEQGDFSQIQMEGGRGSSLLGNIYLGKVQNVVKNIQAAFVEIADGRVCYLSLAEKVLPICSKGMAAREGKGAKVCIGDEILVQVATEAIKTKPPTLTGCLTLTGRYLVLTRGKTQISLSTKIKGEEKRQILKEQMQKFKNEEYGFIIRTNAIWAEPGQLEKEAENLITEYEKLKKQGIHQNRFSLVYEAPQGYITHIRDGYQDKVEQILTDDRQIYQNLKNYMEKFQAEDMEKLKLYQDENISLSLLYNLSAKLKKVLAKQVWLKSGASIVIEPTESLTAIDVNTGKAIKGRKNTEETFFKINCEAATEIARQLRLRNLSGMILIDFIDMQEKEKRQALLNHLREEVKKDPVKTMVVDITALGLVEVTRKRIRQPLHEMMGKEE